MSLLQHYYNTYIQDYWVPRQYRYFWPNLATTKLSLFSKILFKQIKKVWQRCHKSSYGKTCLHALCLKNYSEIFWGEKTKRQKTCSFSFLRSYQKQPVHRHITRNIVAIYLSRPRYSWSSTAPLVTSGERERAYTLQIRFQLDIQTSLWWRMGRNFFP